MTNLSQTLDASNEALAVAVPIPMVLHCPCCHALHIDAPDGGAWDNPPHKSHWCHTCGYIWRPADAATTGVAAIATRGVHDSPPMIPNEDRGPVALPWQHGVLRGWSILSLRHSHRDGIRFLEVVMTDGARTIEAEGTHEIHVFERLARLAQRTGIARGTPVAS